MRTIVFIYFLFFASACFAYDRPSNYEKTEQDKRVDVLINAGTHYVDVYRNYEGVNAS